jgi:hypothetical protein
VQVVRNIAGIVKGPEKTKPSDGSRTWSGEHRRADASGQEKINLKRNYFERGTMVFCVLLETISDPVTPWCMPVFCFSRYAGAAVLSFLFSLGLIFDIMKASHPEEHQSHIAKVTTEQ